MALVKCKDCGEEMSKKAKQCPQCGAPNKRAGFFSWIIAIFIGVAVYGWVTDDGSSITYGEYMSELENSEYLQEGATVCFSKESMETVVHLAASRGVEGLKTMIAANKCAGMPQRKKMAVLDIQGQYVQVKIEDGGEVWTLRDMLE